MRQGGKMKDSHKDHTFQSRMVMVGFGSIGQGVLPLLLRHLEMKPDQMLIITADNAGTEIARKYGVPLQVSPLTPHNYLKLLGPRLAQGDFLLNLSVDV